MHSENDGTSAGPGLRFHVLGPVRAERDGQPLQLGSPQQRAALAILLLRDGRPLSVSEFVGALWGDAPPQRAVTTLRSYVSRLRATLEPDRPPRGRAQLLVSAGGGFAVRAEDGALDAAVFQDHLTAAASARRAGDTTGAHERLTCALRLWEGTALAGLPGPYAERERARLAELRLAAREDLLDCALALGRHEAVVADLRALAAEDPLRERPRALLMLALHRAGRQAEALAVYADARRLLAEKLGVEPGPELGRLHERVLAGDPALAAAPVAVAVAAPAAADCFPPDVAGFTGRAETVARVREALAPGGGRGTPLAVLTGPGGAGKTALAVHTAYALRGALPDGRIHVDLRGEALDAPGHLLRELGVTDESMPEGPERRTALYRSLTTGRRMLILLDDARDADQILRLMPGGSTCAVLATGCPQGTPPGAQVIEVGPLPEEEAEALLRAAGAGGRAGLGAPDREAGSEERQARAEVPGAQAEATPGARAGLGAPDQGAGSEERQARAEVPGAQAEATPGARAGLGAPDHGAGSESPQAHSPDAGGERPDRPGPAPAAAHALVAACDGLPLALRIARAQLAAGAFTDAAGLASALEDERKRLAELREGDGLAVEAACRIAYAALGPDAARAFRLTALPDVRSFDAAVAAALLETDEATAEALARDLVAAGLVETAGPGRYGHHDLVKRSARQQSERTDSPPVRDAALLRLLDHHLATAVTALLRTRPDSPLPRHLHHRLATTGRPLHDVAGARAWLHDTHPYLLATVRQLLALDVPGALRPAADLLTIWAQLTSGTARHRDVEEPAGQALERARQAGDDAVAARLLRLLGAPHHGPDTYERAERDLRASLRMAEAAGDGLTVTLASHELGVVLTSLGRPEEALPLLVRAEERLRADGAASCAIEALADTGRAAMAAGRTEEALKAVNEAVDRAREPGHAPALAHALHQAGWVYLRTNRPAVAVERFREALELATGGPVPDPRREALLWARLAHCRLAQRQHREALTAADRALEIEGRLGDAYCRGLALAARGRALPALGEPRPGLGCLREAYEVLESRGAAEAAEVQAQLEAEFPGAGPAS